MGRAAVEVVRIAKAEHAHLLADRLHYIDEAARLKLSRREVRDEARIAEVLAKVETEALRLGANPRVVAAAYRALIEASVAHEFESFDQLKR